MDNSECNQEADTATDLLNHIKSIHLGENRYKRQEVSAETNKVLEKQNEEPGKIIIDFKENNDQEIFAKENEVKQQETIKIEEKEKTQEKNRKQLKE